MLGWDGIKFLTKNKVVQASVSHEFIYKDPLIILNATPKKLHKVSVLKISN